MYFLGTPARQWTRLDFRFRRYRIPTRLGKPIRKGENEKTDVSSTGIAFAAVPFFRDWLGAGDRLHHRRGEGCIGSRRAGSGRNRPARGNRDHAHSSGLWSMTFQLTTFPPSV